MELESVMAWGAPFATGDLDCAERAISSTYLPSRLHIARGAKLSMELSTIAVGRVTLGRVHFGTVVRIVTDEPAHYHVNVPVAGRARSTAGQGSEVVTDPGSATVFMPGAAVELHLEQDVRQICLMLEAAEVELELSRLLGRELTSPLVFGETMDLRSQAGQTWMATIDLIEREARHQTGLLAYQLTARRLEQLLIDGLLVGHVHNYSDAFSSARTKVSDRAARKAVELLQERTEHPWTVTELASSVSVSVRSLHAAFRELTGVGPMAYLRDLRLHEAHESLVAADPRHTTVSHIAYQWGFSHLGRFALSYRTRFGELPVDTLKRS
jgi:AraC-like DNA-binding protein